MLDWLRKKTRRPRSTTPVERPPAPEPKPEQTAKELATAQGEPYVSVVSMDVDPDNLHQGSFELDWNEYFVARLVKAGYQGKDESQLVDQWFRDICRNVLMENFEQWEANQPFDSRPRIIDRKDLGGGRTEAS